MALLKTRYSEVISDSIKIAILLGMLPKEIQEVVLHKWGLKEGSRMSLEQVRDYTVNLANQKVALMKPAPTALDAVGNGMGSGFWNAAKLQVDTSYRNDEGLLPWLYNACVTISSGSRRSFLSRV